MSIVIRVIAGKADVGVGSDDSVARDLAAVTGGARCGRVWVRQREPADDAVVGGTVALTGRCQTELSIRYLAVVVFDAVCATEEGRVPLPGVVPTGGRFVKETRSTRTGCVPTKPAGLIVLSGKIGNRLGLTMKKAHGNQQCQTWATHVVLLHQQVPAAHYCRTSCAA
jgi:hypothetical protein